VHVHENYAATWETITPETLVVVGA
jgi:hypothetical protein